MQLTISSISNLPQAARAIIEHAGNNRIFLFYGDMGAGKTTLIKELCKALGTTDNISSPTFSIVNEYHTAKDKIYHFDFYRLKDQTEALDMGYEEYFYAGAWCFIEWPEKIPDLLPEHYSNITIKVLDDGARLVSIENI
ncbi:tRNA (adenosine(37)-N6)-threonylcarbamoyltransferase complex ATPase subunit type 1 TsaE [Mucilaginibacter ginsenosidivorax]|uniref:tRNA threonylcarbamoyladenosine biosynthesis protein TsaE n=1 Tax=Mucilaginibacter ginsenosidivorax TaxID=862126 RepID=A0A5B8W300_9SPHI|nr:tRNA (adenosine(37)-N6)-threonylcarbamoyltransferase complex ATPase subunit type 1 TsaE [Mucilaginibacter ginsenosidivorax]QEC77312.1 tRNA (adenosine(37)-N6)-threonylcarbamoyltransferase complex ATPase subunit type 1 TsaE [Mucilaginibacter ginsenosidivorax]